LEVAATKLLEGRATGCQIWSQSIEK